MNNYDSRKATGWLSVADPKKRTSKPPDVDAAASSSPSDSGATVSC